MLVLAGHPVALVGAAIIVGLGECLHTTALTPLVADLAPPDPRGRYMATIGVSFWLGLALAPTLDAQLLTGRRAARPRRPGARDHGLGADARTRSAARGPLDRARSIWPVSDVRFLQW